MVKETRVNRRHDMKRFVCLSVIDATALLYVHDLCRIINFTFSFTLIVIAKASSFDSSRLSFSTIYLYSEADDFESNSNEHPTANADSEPYQQFQQQLSKPD